LLRTGGPRADALSLAEDLLTRLGGLGGLASARGGALRSGGIGPAKSASVEAALELARRLATRRLQRGDRVSGPPDVFRHFHARLRDEAQERFVVLLLDGRHRVLREEVISQGTLTASLVHPREVFRPALREAAAALVLVHNHPSGDPTPSHEDRVVTTRLQQAGEVLGIPVLDHVIVADQGFVSLRDEGLLPGTESSTTPAGSEVGQPRKGG
jgi:DNA repair protein RadC